VELCGLDVVSVTIILRFCVSLQVIPHFMKECQLRIGITFDNRLQKPIAKMNPASWIAQQQGVRGLLLFYRHLNFSNCDHHHLLVHHKSKRITKIPADIVTVKKNVTAVTKGTCQQYIYQFV
jgi:hypothetical protein